MRAARNAGIFLGLALAAAACAPKGTTGGTPTPSITPASSPRPETPLPTPTPVPIGPRSFWNDPAIRPGESLTWTVVRDGSSERLVELPTALSGSGNDATFSAAGGSFLGNEVLRVTAGDFRARHAVVVGDGRTWHLYLVRTVPGGIAKAEMIPDGTNDPTIVYELDAFTRIPRPEPAP